MFKRGEAAKYSERVAARPPIDVAKLRELSDRFNVNSVARLVQLAHNEGYGGKIKGLYRMAEEALSKNQTSRSSGLPSFREVRWPRAHRGSACK